MAAALGVGGLALTMDAEAKKKKKKIFCLNGDTVKAKNKKKKKRLRNQGATKGKCPDTCTPVCPTNGSCGMDDGCGNRCGCAGDTICVAGTCTACTVTCSGDAAACGTTLQTALTTGGMVYVCPGRYATAAGFTMAPGTSIFGAGSGSDQASNTILDGQNTSGVTVINTVTIGATTFAGLRITGGNGTVGGMIVSSLVEAAVIDDCAIVGNTGSSVGGLQVIGLMTVRNSNVSGNTGGTVAGGINYVPIVLGQAGTISNSVIDGNEGATFGGIQVTSNIASSLTVDSATRITNNAITVNSGERAGGIGRPDAGFATITATGATISGNTAPQCRNVTGCSS